MAVITYNANKKTLDALLPRDPSELIIDQRTGLVWNCCPNPDTYKPGGDYLASKQKDDGNDLWKVPGFTSATLSYRLPTEAEFLGLFASAPSNVAAWPYSKTGEDTFKAYLKSYLWTTTPFCVSVDSTAFKTAYVLCTNNSVAQNNDGSPNTAGHVTS